MASNLRPRAEWLTLDPGELRHRVQIQQSRTAPDDVGQERTTWTTVLTSWAKISMASQRELDRTGLVTSEVSHLIVMRFPLKVSVYAGMRVRFGSHTYSIQSPENIEERNLVLRLYVLEINGTE